MGNECSAIKDGYTETTLLTSSGTIASATNYDDDEECEWSFDPSGLQNDVMVIDVTSTDVKCNKASFKVSGTQYCQTTEPFCLIFVIGGCKERYNPQKCQMRDVDWFPKIKFRGKDDAENNGFKLKYTFANCEKLSQPTTVATTLPSEYLNTTLSTGNSTAIADNLPSDNTTRLVNTESSNFTTSHHNSIANEFLTAASPTNTLSNIVTILLPLLLVILLLAVIVFVILCIRRRTGEKKVQRRPPDLITSVEYIAADDIDRFQASTSEFEQSYESIPQSTLQPDIVPVYSVINKFEGAAYSINNYEMVNVQGPAVQTNVPTCKNSPNPNGLARKSSPAAYSIVRRSPKNKFSDSVNKEVQSCKSFAPNRESQYVVADDVEVISTSQSDDKLGLSISHQDSSKPKNSEYTEAYSVIKAPKPSKGESRYTVDEGATAYDNPSFDAVGENRGMGDDLRECNIYNRLSRI